MSETVFLLATLASLAVSVTSLLVTVAAYRRLDDEASETFATIGADEGNHEARLERLETNAGLKVIPSPSALDAMLEGNDPEGFAYAFGDEQENTELQGCENVESFENEGGTVGVAGIDYDYAGRTDRGN